MAPDTTGTRSARTATDARCDRPHRRDGRALARYLKVRSWLAVGALVVGSCACQRPPDDDFRVYPYVQSPATEAMTVMWLARGDQPGRLGVLRPGQAAPVWMTSQPRRADTLAYDRRDRSACRQGTGCGVPYLHRIRVRGLRPDTQYEYTVEQGQSRFRSAFRTAPGRDQRRPIRLILYADCETEPESTGARVIWDDPRGRQPDRRYPIDQTRGYAANLNVIRSRRPDLIAIAGDLVEAGGKQQDWDEFWRHLAGPDGRTSIAGRIPVMPAPGNHEYFAGPDLGGYREPHSSRAIARYLTYFEAPDSPRSDLVPVSPDSEGRYYRLDYGPLTLIALDVANDSPQRSARDSNFFLAGEGDEGGGRAPMFGPGSRQYVWLRGQLEDAQARGQFTVVMFHHTPYSVGPHGWPPPPARTGHTDPQSGVPVRRLTPLLMEYGVDAVVTGHDEMWERSQVTGRERLRDGRLRAHVIHFYDVGIGGDGLRAPQPGLQNPYQAFLAHRDAPEVWRDGVLQSGGKHYGHLEIDLTPEPDGRWRAVLEPVYILPQIDTQGHFRGYQRRVYADVITLHTDGAE